MFGLEDSRGTAAWDQFAVNKEKFNVNTTWDEHLYTTRIDRNACGISEQEASRLAREIESGVSTTTNVHMLEERGGELDADVSCTDAKLMVALQVVQARLYSCGVQCVCFVHACSWDLWHAFIGGGVLHPIAHGHLQLKK